MHPRSAILTLVGEGIDGTSDVAARTSAALKPIPVTMISSVCSKLAMSLIVPSAEMRRSVEMLHREFFQKIDGAVFAECQDAGSKNPEQFSTSSDPGGAVRNKNRTTISPSHGGQPELKHER